MCLHLRGGCALTVQGYDLEGHGRRRRLLQVEVDGGGRCEVGRVVRRAALRDRERVAAHEEEVAARRAAADAVPFRSDAVVEEVRVGGEHRGRELLERPDVVQDPDAASVRAGDQVVVARVDDEVVDGHGGQSVHEPVPGASAVERREQRELGAGEQQIGILQILLDDVHGLVLRHGGRQAGPGAAPVGRAEYVWAEVVAAVAVDADVRGRGVEA